MAPEQHITPKGHVRLHVISGSISSPSLLPSLLQLTQTSYSHKHVTSPLCECRGPVGGLVHGGCGGTAQGIGPSLASNQASAHGYLFSLENISVGSEISLQRSSLFFESIITKTFQNKKENAQKNGNVA